MSSKIRIEYVRPQRAGDGHNLDPYAIMDVVAAGETLVVGAVSGQSAAAPDFPEDRGLRGGVFARLTCLAGAVIVTEAAANPVATEAAGVRLTPGQAVLLPAETGQKFAAIEAAPDEFGRVGIAIANGASLSAAALISPGQIVRGLVTPAAWTAAPLSFDVSIDGAAYGSLRYPDGTEFYIPAVPAGAYVPLPTVPGLTGVKLRSGLVGAAVNQGADRAFSLVTG